MHTFPALRAGALALACVLAPAVQASGTLELLTGIPRLACEATLCLSSSLRPGECSRSLDHYFSIKKFNKCSGCSGGIARNRGQHGAAQAVKDRRRLPGRKRGTHAQSLTARTP